MSMWLRQSTAGQEILLGPFLDDTDGKTAETALTISNTDIKLWKEGATTEANKNSGGATHIASGRYYAVLDATDTNTLGKLEVNVHESGALPVRREFMVMPANVYDSLVLGTDNLEVDTTKISGTTQTARDLGASVLLSPGTGTGQISLTSGAVTAGTVSDKTGYSLSQTFPTNFADLSISATTGLVDITQTAADKAWSSSTRILTAGTNLNDLSAAEVNAEVVDALATDTYGEPAQGAPAATTTLAAKINYLYKAWRNKSTQTATTYALYDDAGSTVDHKATVSDDGTTATKGEIVTGP